MRAHGWLTGVFGNMRSGIGVHGLSYSERAPDADEQAIGVRGTSVTGAGVLGDASGGPRVEGHSSMATGVYGRSQQEAGVTGLSDKQTGVFGGSWDPRFAFISQEGRHARVGISGLVFDGTAVYGEGVQGLVNIDPDFSALVDMSDYHVFPHELRPRRPLCRRVSQGQLRREGSAVRPPAERGVGRTGRVQLPSSRPST